MKRLTFTVVQPAILLVILLVWAFMPASLFGNPLIPTVASIFTFLLVQALEFAQERHESWRLDRRELITDLFYLALNYTLINALVSRLADTPLSTLKDKLGITTIWLSHLPFLVQVAFAWFVFELGQYWMHRLMHNSFLWWTHAPHHHITKLNALKGLVGNPIELFLISLGLTSLLDLQLNAVFCSFNLLVAVAAFAHANVRFHTPRWYSYIFTTNEAHSLHHRVGFLETRCNYANTLILIDRVFGTFREGEAEIVGQDDCKRLSVKQQFLFPLRPLFARIKGE